MVELFDDWREEDAEFLNTDVRDEEYDPEDVDSAASTAMDLLGIERSDGKEYVIPLFAEGEPVPTNEYVLYRPDQGQIGWFDSGFGVNGTERFTDADRLDSKVIGHRDRNHRRSRGSTRTE